MPGPLGVDQLVHVVGGIGLPGEDPVDPEILRAHRRVEVLPVRVLGIGRRGDRARARHGRSRTTCRPGRAGPDPCSCSSRDRCRTAPRPSSWPRPRRRRGWGTAAGRPRRWARRSRSRPAGSCRARRSRRRDTSLRWRTGRRAVGAALVEPQPEALRIGALRLVEAGLVDQAEIVPAVAAAVLQLGMRGDRLEEVEGAEGVVGQPVPEPVVAAGPDQPHVAALDLVGGQRDAVVHRLEVVLVRPAGTTPRRRPGLLRLVRHARRRDRGHAQGRAQPSDRCEEEAQDPRLLACHARPSKAAWTMVRPQSGVGGTDRRDGTIVQSTVGNYGKCHFGDNVLAIVG